MSKLLRGMGISSITILTLLAGCQPKDPPPFNPRVAQQDERAAGVGTPLPSPRPLPTTLQSPFPEPQAPGMPASTRPEVRPATGPAIGAKEPVVRISLRELVQRAVANS